MIEFRYWRWDGTQEPFGPDARALFDRLAEGLFEHGDLTRALHELFRQGLPGRLPGLRELLARLDGRRRAQLARYDLDSVLEDLRRRLDHVLELEWAAIERALADGERGEGTPPPPELDPGRGVSGSSEPGRAPVGRGGDPAAPRARAEAARRRLETLPASLGGAIRALLHHDFLDPTAREEFQALLDLLRGHVLGRTIRDSAERLRSMTPEERTGLRELLGALNRMLRERLAGREPRFAEFMDRFGAFFGPDPPRTLDELLDRLARDVARLQALLAGLDPAFRDELAEALREALDPETEAALEELGELLARLRPLGPRTYPFRGEEGLTLDQAMEVLGELQALDGLEHALRQAERTGNLDGLDPARVGELLGAEAERALRQLRDAARILEAAGYARRRGARWELTARAVRRLGERALGEVFTRLGRGRAGGHRTPVPGSGGEPTGETRPWEPGEPLDLDIGRTLLNALARRGPGTPVRLALEDLEVERQEATVAAATALLLDQSSSMFYQGRWPAAKKVALALQALIRTRFPRDRLVVIGFSDYAAELRPEELPAAEPNVWRQGTNLHHALLLARRRLAREPAAARQILLVTDGDPTAHLEGGEAVFSYPPTRRTLAATLREVRRCTAAGIVINTFMLDRTPYLVGFVDSMTRLNRGRAFFAEPGRLGHYVLVDYLARRRRCVG